MKPNKTAREFEKMKLDPIRCYSWDEIWNWHISQLKSLRDEIENFDMTKYEDQYIADQALDDVLLVLDRFIK